MGFGVTTYFSIHNQEQVNRTFAQALTDSGEVALFSDVDDFSEENGSIASCFWSDEAATPVQSFASQDTCEFIT